MDFSEFVYRFIGLFVVCNPLAALPAVLRITRHQSLPEKRRTGLITAFSVGIILLISTWAGTPILRILDIELSSFQVAGGFILFMMALAMLNAEESPLKNPEEAPKASDVGAVVPLAIPIIAGPGAISTAIVGANQFPGMFNLMLLSFAAIAVACVMGVLLYFASNLEKLFGKSGINVMNRLGGLILSAIAIQTMATGIRGLFF